MLATNSFLKFSLLVVILYESHETNAKVEVATGHYVQPFLNKTEDTILLENKDIVVQFKCLASYPTEWTFNDDDTTRNSKTRLRIEWTDRKFKKSIDETSYDYIAWIHLQYSKVVEIETIICRDVSNHKDNIKVVLQPNNNNEVQITYSTDDENYSIKEKDPTDYDFAVPTIKKQQENDYAVNFSIATVQNNNNYNEYYWHCELEDGSIGKITFHDCRWSAVHCANTFRDVKQLDKTITLLNNPTSLNVNDLDADWTGMNNNYNNKVPIPGVAICSGKNKVGKEQRRGVEYFFSTSQPQQDANSSNNYNNASVNKLALQYQLHVSWNEIQPQGLIWIDHSSITKNEWFTDETLTTTCNVPKYGFSFDPVFILLINGSRVMMEREYTEDFEANSWTKKIELNFGKYGPGTYTLQCIAPVWNTTEWIYQNKTVIVKDRKQWISNVHANIGTELSQININLQKFNLKNTEHFDKTETLLQKLVDTQSRILQIQEELLLLQKEKKARIPY